MIDHILEIINDDHRLSVLDDTDRRVGVYG